jgi:hypothetical protein
MPPQKAIFEKHQKVIWEGRPKRLTIEWRWERFRSHRGTESKQVFNYCRHIASQLNFYRVGLTLDITF